jgi:hypothetical protein
VRDKHTDRLRGLEVSQPVSLVVCHLADFSVTDLENFEIREKQKQKS